MATGCSVSCAATGGQRLPQSRYLTSTRSRGLSAYSDPSDGRSTSEICSSPTSTTHSSQVSPSCSSFSCCGELLDAARNKLLLPVRTRPTSATRGRRWPRSSCRGTAMVDTPGATSVLRTCSSAPPTRSSRRQLWPSWRAPDTAAAGDYPGLSAASTVSRKSRRKAPQTPVSPRRRSRRRGCVRD